MSSRNFQKPIRVKGHRLVLTKKMIDLYKAEPISLPPWDPMGSLAI